MITPAEVIRGTTTQDVTACLDYVNRYLHDLFNRGEGNIDYEEQHVLTLPHMLNAEEIYAFEYLLSHAGWSNVRVVAQTGVTFYFPSKAS